MSDDTTTTSDEGKRKRKAADDKFVGENKNEPVPRRPDFFEWLEQLFSGETQFPERVEVRIVKGKRLETMGPKLMGREWPAGSQKPTKEWLVRWSNEILARCQMDCDAHRNEVVYQIAAIHFSVDTQPYDRFLVRCKPSPTFRYGDGGDENGDDEENGEKKFSTQIMSHQKDMSEIFAQGLMGMMDRQDRIIERLLQRNEHLEGRWEKTMDMVERAASQQAEREDRAKWTDMKIASINQGISIFAPMVPPIIGALTGKTMPQQVPQGASVADTPDAMTLRNFVTSLSPQQLDAVFGKYDGTPENKLVEVGILSYEQAMLFAAITNLQVSTDRIDDFMPGGAHEITMEQINRIVQTGVSMLKLAPLKIMFDARQARKNDKK